MNRRDTLILAILVCVFTSVYAIGGLSHYRLFESGSDLAIFDQAIWHASRYESPASTISGFSNILADHFYPILGLFVPLYWIVAAPPTLIIVQSLLLGVSLVPVFLFLRGKLTSGPALTLTAAYGLFWGMQRTATFDVHEFAFAPLFIATLILAMQRKQWAVFWIAALGTFLVKEDLIPLLGFVGLYLFVQVERRRGAWLMSLAAVGFVALVGFVLSRIGDSSGYRYTGGYEVAIRRPWTIPIMLVTPAVKVQTMLSWLAPFLFLPLLSPLSTLAIPLVLERFLSPSVNHWGVIFHYSAPFAPILATSAGDGLARLARRFPDEPTRHRVVRMLAAVCVVLSAIVPGHQPLWQLFSKRSYQLTDVHRAGYRALQQIPPGASVVAQTPVASHLSHRDRIFLLAADAPDADFVIASSALSTWPLEGVAQLNALIAERQQRGYEMIFQDQSWIVLRHPRR
jgi:uncharacterized membrane protein